MRRVTRVLATLTWALVPSGLARAADPPIPPGAKPQNLGAMQAGEGPVWRPGDGLYFTGGDRITRLDLNGGTHVFREPSSAANGLLFDFERRLIVCEARNRRLTRTELDGAITVLADNYQGKKFNSPNDLTIDSKGRIYFSDPRYGNRDSIEMFDESGRAVEGVYRIDAPGKVSRIITHEADRPNGLLVSARDEYLYVADNNNNTAGGARILWRFDLRPDGVINAQSKKLIFDWEDGRGPDGLEMDQQGRLYVAGGLTGAHGPFESAEKFKGGVYVLSPGGELLAFVAVPVDEVTNVAFGGEDWKTLFVTAGGTLWSIRLNTPGSTPLQTR
jgi:gluconolactonase